MNFNEETYWQIEDYIKGKLDGSALVEFESKMTKDTNLKLEIELQKLADKLIVENRLLSASHVSLNTIESLKNSYSRKKIVVAGIVALISICTLSYYIFQKESIQYKNVMIAAEKKESKKNTIEAILPPAHKKTKPEVLNVEAKREILNPSASTLNLIIDTLEKSSKTQTELLKTEIVKQEDPAIMHSMAIPIKNPCTDVKIKGNVTVKNACLNEANGQIYVNGFQGGSSPYTYKVFSVKNGNLVATDNLSEGFYDVKIFDNSSCSVTYSNIAMKEISCFEIEKSFNPFIGEILELGEKDQEGILIIYSKDGDTHYSKHFSKNENLQWNGASNNGVNETGYYIYTIKYKDGTSIQGEVTVTR